MQLIPLRFIHESDKYDLPGNLLDLAFIYRQGFPLGVDGFITPPDRQIQNIFNKLQIVDYTSLEVNEQKIKILLGELIHQELLSIDNDTQTATEAAQELATNWLSLIKSGLLKGDINFPLLPILSIPKKDLVHAAGTICFNKKNKEVLINIEKGTLNIETETELLEIIQKIDKLLIPTRIFSWILTDHFKIIDCRILTQRNVEVLPKKIDVVSRSHTGSIQIKTVNKVFGLKTENSLSLPQNVDGFILPNINDSEQRLFEISEYSVSLASKLLIYTLSSELNDQEILDLVFLRKTKNLHNINLALLSFKSISYLNTYLDKLEQKGFRKDIIWVTFSDPENILNIDNYLNLGIKNIILDLDSLIAKLMGEGFNSSNDEVIQTLLKFLSPYTKQLMDHKLNLLLTGHFARNEDILQWFSDKRLITVGSPEEDVSSVRDYLKFLEQRRILKRTLHS